ncbi:MAG: hypothetical protein J6X58_00555 [Bacteroidales bacterium]|nr:hypothetical protein [Bacteroidales bacterium]
MTENKNKKGRSISEFLGGDVLGSRAVLRQIPLLLLILVFCLIMVAVRYRVESLNKEKARLKQEVSRMKEERVQMQRQYQYSIRISRIDRELDTIGIGLVAGPPYEIKIKNNDKQ